MSRTTDQWQELLEGATPGPWEHDGESGVRGPREPDDLGRGPALLAAMQMPHRQPRKRHNAFLMAAAPEAVAEVIRLRRELEELKFRLTSYWQPQTRYEEGLEAGYRYTADDITRILNGENHA